jgi:hypothetical protein
MTDAQTGILQCKGFSVSTATIAHLQTRLKALQRKAAQ